MCSRNWELSPPAAPEQANVYWRAIADAGLGELLEPGAGWQAEIAGPGIQANPLGLNAVRVIVFAYLIDGDPQPRAAWPAVSGPTALLAPVYDLRLPPSAAEAVEVIDGIKSLVTPGRLAEGVVWHRANGQGLDVLAGRSTFKTISNRYLVKSGS